jgi:hypothetical protein
MVSGLKHKDYENRCKELGIQTLAQRRQAQDLAQVYRYSKGTGNIKLESLFDKPTTRAGPVSRQSGDSENFKVQMARLDIRKHSFTVRTVQKWNALPRYIKTAKNMESFKSELKKWQENGGRPQ